MKPVIKIGRDNTNDIVINEPRISRTHAIVTDLGNGTYEVKDLGSTNGSFVNGMRITHKIITENDKLELAGSIVNWHSAFLSPRVVSSPVEEQPFAAIRKTVIAGSNPENDVVIDDSFVSSLHAKVSLLSNGDYYIEDLNSSNGTYVNGARIVTKNFTKTDVVRMAATDLPADWFLNKKLQYSFFGDNRKKILSILSVILLSAAGIVCYVNSCQWFGWNCIMTSEQVYEVNRNSLVHIKHDYYYTIDLNGKKYFVGKNKDFKVTEANTSIDNLLPYGSVTGNGTIIKSDGTILTSPSVINPWLDKNKTDIMLKEVKESKTILNFKPSIDFKVCGHTAVLAFIPNGQVNNQQNYIAATAKEECVLMDSAVVFIYSVKKVLPAKSSVVNYNFNNTDSNKLNNTGVFYYSAFNAASDNQVIKDTFYTVKEKVNINEFPSVPLNNILPALPEGSAAFNGRGEMIGFVQQGNLILLHQFINQIK